MDKRKEFVDNFYKKREDFKDDTWINNMKNNVRQELKLFNREVIDLSSINMINNIKDIMKAKNSYFKTDLERVKSISCGKIGFESTDLYNCINEIYNNPSLTYENSLFFQLMKKDRISNFSELTDIKSKNFELYSKYELILPWHSLYYKQKNHISRFEGILSNRCIEMHFLKFKSIIHLINKKGYLNLKSEKKNLISGFFLVDKEKFKFIVTRGIHRILVLKFFKIKEFFLTHDEDFPFITNKKELDNWRAVKEKLISKDICSKLFDFYIS